MYTGSEGLSLQANFVILGLLCLEMLSFVTRFNISGSYPVWKLTTKCCISITLESCDRSKAIRHLQDLQAFSSKLFYCINKIVRRLKR